MTTALVTMRALLFDGTDRGRSDLPRYRFQQAYTWYAAVLKADLGRTDHFWRKLCIGETRKMVFSYTSLLLGKCTRTIWLCKLLRGMKCGAYTETISISIKMPLHVYKYGCLSLSIEGHRHRLAGHETASSSDLISRYFDLLSKCSAHNYSSSS